MKARASLRGSGFFYAVIFKILKGTNLNFL
jgi:hypothetical protein